MFPFLIIVVEVGVVLLLIVAPYILMIVVIPSHFELNLVNKDKVDSKVK